MSEPQTTTGPEIWQCPRCRYEAPARQGWSINPRQGYAVCPTCWHHGYDIVPRTKTPATVRRN